MSITKTWNPENGKSFKVVSDGSMVGTKIYDAQGNLVHGVQEITLKISVDDPVVRAEIVVFLPKLDISDIKVMSVETPVEPVYELGSEGKAVDLIKVPKARKNSS